MINTRPARNRALKGRKVSPTSAMQPQRTDYSPQNVGALFHASNGLANENGRSRQERPFFDPCTTPSGKREMARVTGLEPATSGVTGRRSNQLSYTRLSGSPKRGALFMSRPRSGQAANASDLHIMQHLVQPAAK